MKDGTTPGAHELDVPALRSELVSAGVRMLAVDGCGGSGKSLLAARLADGWTGAVVVQVDDFYRPVAERRKRPRVHGENVDLQRLAEQVLEPVSRRNAGRYQRYDWDADELAEWHEVRGDCVLVVEGVYSSCAAIRSFFDYVIWVACPCDVRLRRGVQRDGEQMRHVWVEEWMPAEARYFEDERPQERADLVVDGGADGAWRPGVARDVQPDSPQGTN